jgi:hypothetical protein
MKGTVGQAFLVAAAGVAVHALLFVVLAGWMVFVVPGYRYEFADYALKLPRFTETVILVSNWFCHYWYVAVPFLFPLCVLDGAVLVLAWVKPGTRVLAILWFLLVAMLPTLYLMIASYSLWLAHNKLMENLSR